MFLKLGKRRRARVMYVESNLHAQILPEAMRRRGGCFLHSPQYGCNKAARKNRHNVESQETHLQQRRRPARSKPRTRRNRSSGRRCSRGLRPMMERSWGSVGR